MTGIYKFFQNWKQINEKILPFWSSFFLIGVSFSFIVSDWMLGIFTFSEYIIGLLMFLLVVTGLFKIERSQIKWIITILSFLSIHLLLQYGFNQEFNLKIGVATFIKLSFYIITIIGLYNYIAHQNLKKKFLIYNNFFAIVGCVIGVYIMVAIYSEGVLPYEFLWQFTRLDNKSYIFSNGNISFVRMRSLFSEPSYFGFYLNTILAMNYFNSDKIKINHLFSIIISFSILLTVSYSAIAIMIVITIMYIFSIKRNNFEWSWFKVIIFGTIILIGAKVYDIFKPFFYNAFIQRTIDIFTDNSNSGYFRLFGSWQYVNKNNFLMGNGLGQTPAIWNIYAYMISDMGIFGLIIFIMFTLMILRMNKKLGFTFILLNFSKGGYLSSSFWLLVLLLLVYTNRKEDKVNSGFLIKT